MSMEDADRVQKMFDRSDDPKFSIISRINFEGGEGCLLELIAESYMIVWYLAKNVQSEHEWNERLKSTIDAATKKINKDREEIQEKLNQLNNLK